MVRGLGPQSIVDPAGRRILQGTDRSNIELLYESATFGPDVEVVGSMPVLQFTPTSHSTGMVDRCGRHVLSARAARGLDHATTSVGARRCGSESDCWRFSGAFARPASISSCSRPSSTRTPLPVRSCSSWAARSTTCVVDGDSRFRSSPSRFRCWRGWQSSRFLRLSIGVGPDRSAGVFSQYLWLTLLLAGLVSLTQVKRLRAFDVNAGNLCYGVYLNHFLVGGLLLRAGATGLSRSSGSTAIWLRGVAGIHRARVRHVSTRRASVRSRQGSSARRLQSAARACRVWRTSSDRRAGGCSVPDPARQPGGAGGRICEPVERQPSCPRRLRSTSDGGPGRLMAIDRASRPSWGSRLSDRSRGIQAIARGPTVSARRLPIACVRCSHIGRVEDTSGIDPNRLEISQ